MKNFGMLFVSLFFLSEISATSLLGDEIGGTGSVEIVFDATPSTDSTANDYY